MSGTKRRKLRLSPRHVMTGDVLADKPRKGTVVEEIVTYTEEVRAQLWSIETLLPNGDTSAARYAVQRRLTIFRTGPKGLGE